MPSMPGMLMSSSRTSTASSVASFDRLFARPDAAGHDDVVLEAEQLGQVVAGLDDVVNDDDLDGLCHYLILSL